MSWTRGDIVAENLSGLQIIFTISAMGLTILYFYLYILERSVGKWKSRSSPPGPWGFPLVGHLPLLGKAPMKTLAKYRETFGDVFSVRMGSYPAVVLNGVHVIKDAMTKYTDELAERPQLYTSRLLKMALGGGTGMTFQNYGPAWKAHRKISHNALGMFVKHRIDELEMLVHEEGEELIKLMLANEASPFDPSDEIRNTTGRIIYQLLFGRRTNTREDKQFCYMTKNLDGFFRLKLTGSPFDIMPWTRYFYQGHISRFLRFVGNAFEVSSLQVKQHRDTLHNGHIRDFTDALLQAADEISPEQKQKICLTNEQILSIIPEVQAAAMDTIGTVLQWAVLYMATLQPIQRRVQKEIDEHIGTRLPKYEDHTKVPYVEATILEILRCTCIAPLAFPHETTADVNIQGYMIPKGTFVLINLSSTCTDPKVWGDPDIFKPERFLKTGPGHSDDVCIDTTAVDSFLAFGLGKRQCLGKRLVKAELFLLFTMIMQRCCISKVPGILYDLEGRFGLLVTTQPYTIIANTEILGR